MRPDRFEKMVNRLVGNPDNGPSRMGITKQAVRQETWEAAACICDDAERYYKAMRGQGDHFDIAARRCAEKLRAKAQEV
jgi:hypothetical protein